MADEEDELAPRMSNADQIVGSEMCTCPDGTCEWCEAVLPEDEPWDGVFYILPERSGSPARALDLSEWTEAGYVDTERVDHGTFSGLNPDTTYQLDVTFDVDPDVYYVLYGTYPDLPGCERCQGVGECGWCK